MHDDTSKWQASVFVKRKRNAYATEAERNASSEDSLIRHSARNVRYQQGGLHERLKNAALKQATGMERDYQRIQHRAFIGNRLPLSYMERGT